MVAVQRVIAAAAVMVAIISAAARMNSSFFLPKPFAFLFPNVPNSASSISIQILNALQHILACHT